MATLPLNVAIALTVISLGNCVSLYTTYDPDPYCLSEDLCSVGYEIRFSCFRRYDIVSLIVC